MGADEKIDWNATDGRFTKHMLAAGVRPRHRVAIAVSGGADSMALCLLAARWSAANVGSLLGLVVDHSLRLESAQEAVCVKQWVCKLGMKCEILKCEWMDGAPTKGRLQEAARNARYALLAQACQRTGVQVLLTAHHADDQAELFILRLSRCSGIAGLAGMASARNMCPVLSLSAGKSPVPRSLHLIRPLLSFRKEELYDVCKQSTQEWVEDPSNLNTLFTRNRIRKALQEPSYRAVWGQIQNSIAFCRRTRTILDRDCDQLLSDVAVVSQELGLVTVDIEKLVASGASDAVLHRVVAALMQFVSQKMKPPRGRAVSSVLHRLQAKAWKGAYTVGGCNILPAPGSKGLKAIICFSPDSPTTSESSQVLLDHSIESLATDICDVLTVLPKAIAHKDPTIEKSNSISKAISVLTRDLKTPRQAVNEFKALGLLSGVGASLLQSLASDLFKDMCNEQSDKSVEGNLKRNSKSTSREYVKGKILFGEYQYFMNRFVISVSCREEQLLKLDAGSPCQREPRTIQGHCSLLRKLPTLWIRHFEEKDWEYLSQMARETSDLRKTSSCKLEAHTMPIKGTQQLHPLNDENSSATALEQCAQELTRTWNLSVESSLPSGTVANGTDGPCKRDPHKWSRCDIERFAKAKETLMQLQRVPKLVRRGLPAIVTAQGLLVGLPSLGFQHCPLVSMTALFCPRTPLSGNQASWD